MPPPPTNRHLLDQNGNAALHSVGVTMEPSMGIKRALVGSIQSYMTCIAKISQQARCQRVGGN